MRRTNIESSLATIIVAALFLVGWVLTAPAATRLSADAGQAGRGNPNPEIPTLSYKLAEWPTAPTTAAGVPGAWNFIQVASVAVAPQGRILVLHRGAQPVIEFMSDGMFLRSWGDGRFSEGKVAAISEAYWTADTSHYSAV